MIIIQFLKKRTLLLAMVLSIFTGLTISLVKLFFPYSELRDKVLDFMSVPGAIAVETMFPQGLHTGDGALFWGYFAMLANFLAYLLVWYVVLCLIKIVAKLYDARANDN